MAKTNSRIKGKQTSMFYGVRRDTRKGIVYYRSEILIDGSRIYLGCYKDEYLAAYAFNLAFGLIMSHNKYKIHNNVCVSCIDSDKVYKKVLNFLVKKGLIEKK